MELKIKHLSPYLPFSLNGTLKEFKDQRQVELIRLGLNPGNKPIVRYRSNDYEFVQYLNHFIPLLRPLEGLNDDIEIKGVKFNPIEKLKEYCDCDAEEDFVDHISTHLDVVDDQIGYGPYTIIQNLFRWHFDVFCLIEDGLAQRYPNGC
jgi:hypothetical protein